MRGDDLRRWREQVGMTQRDLMVELDVASRQTIVTWEKSENLPRVVELAIFALDQIEPCRNRSGLSTQFNALEIAKLRKGNAVNSRFED